MQRLTVILIVSMLLAGCSDGEPVRKLPPFHGQSRAQVVAKLGDSQSVHKFPMSEAYGEFRIELQNTYPLSNAANADVQIEEMTWQDGDYWIMLWFHLVNGQWIVLDSCRWHKNIQF